MSKEKAGKYACFEFERKFLLENLPPSLVGSQNYKQIEDRYFCGTNLRLRTVHSPNGTIERKLTQKYIPKDSDSSKTVITNLYLNDAEIGFLNQLPGKTLRKKRHKLVDDGLVFSIDEFQEPQPNLVIAEIEFDTQEQMNSFILPFNDWKEVTLDVKYSGGFIASLGKGISVRQSPVITTQDMILRLPEMSDVDEILRYHKENESHLSPFSPKKSDGYYTEEFWKERIPKHHEDFQADQAVRLYLFDRQNNKAVIGTLEFSQISRGPFQACYLGYGIAKKHEGKGLMFQGLQAAIDYAFQTLRIHRIMANHLPENHRSAKTLKRLGFIPECVAKNYLFINGAWRDHVLNSLTNMQWVEK
jgi:ribosomal-protein-alanine N-acetyltransferase